MNETMAATGAARAKQAADELDQKLEILKQLVKQKFRRSDSEGADKKTAATKTESTTAGAEE